MRSRISLTTLPQGRIRLEVQDNGVGFEPANIPQDRYGLAGMRERADLIGADLRMEFYAGRGARVALETDA